MNSRETLPFFNFTNIPKNDSHMENLRSFTRSHLFAFLTLILMSGILLGHYYNRFWCPQDEGVFAHVAQRLLDGEVLNKDIEELHPGYANFINALALGLFG